MERLLSNKIIKMNTKKNKQIALMMEAASTSETSVNFYQTTRRNNPEDSHLQASGNLHLNS
jgi:hypothetical protein